jgi:repressor LexA
MIEDGILDGDILLVKAQNVAEQGAIVVARVDSEATVKRYYREEGRVRLQPANRNMEPIILSEEEGRDPSIQGVVIALFRNLTSPP